ncbi:MAG: nucleotide pyrophosphohydrolase [Nitrospirae bacterium]|nr:nucleotide pyrophosphohydrolase [Nitrospirota bacterium]
MDIKGIQQRLRVFAEERDWERFHSPKNLAMALCAEAAELLELFQWLTEEQSRDMAGSERDMDLVREEVADVFIYLARLADKLGIDMEEAVLRKMELNEKKYPVDLSRGNATKYNRRD